MSGLGWLGLGWLAAQVALADVLAARPAALQGLQELRCCPAPGGVPVRRGQQQLTAPARPLHPPAAQASAHIHTGCTYYDGLLTNRAKLQEVLGALLGQYEVRRAWPSLQLAALRRPAAASERHSRAG